MATQVFHFSNSGVSSGQRFYLKDDVSGIFVRNLVLDSDSLITVNGTQVLLSGEAQISPRFGIEYYEEFLTSTAGLREGGLQRIFTSPAQIVNVPTDGAQGVARCETTTDPSLGLRAAMTTDSEAIHFGQGQEIETVWRVKPTLNLFSASLNGVYGVGFANTLGTASFAQKGLFFRSSGDNWNLVVRSGAVENVTPVSPPVAPSLDTWATMRIIINSDASVVSGIINGTGFATINMTSLNPSTLRLNEAGGQTAWTAGLRRQSAVATGVGLDIDFAYLRIGPGSRKW